MKHQEHLSKYKFFKERVYPNFCDVSILSDYATVTLEKSAVEISKKVANEPLFDFYCMTSQLLNYLSPHFPVGNYMFKVNNINTRRRCEICSKLTLKTPERRYKHWRSSGVSIVNFEHISHLVLVFLLLTLS